jgi:hypothetical protein
MMLFSSYSDSLAQYGDPAVFSGLWLHFPENPEGTSTNFRIGRNLRSYSSEVGGRSLVLAGRKFPVVEFGEHANDVFSVSVIIPHGPTYDSEREDLREFAASKRTVVARDNRGVVIFGSIHSLDEDHIAEGSTFTFEVNRVHREEIWVD